MFTSGYGVGLKKRFENAVLSSLVGTTRPGRRQIAFSRLEAEPHFHLLDLTPEKAFTVHVMFNEHTRIRLQDPLKSVEHHDLAQYDCAIYDLADMPNMSVDTGLDTVRMYLPCESLNEMAGSFGVRGDVRLQQPGFGFSDHILVHLAQIIDRATAEPDQVPQLFIDHIALAVQTHLLQTYAERPAAPPTRARGLSIWQERRAKELIAASLNKPLTIDDLAKECGLSNTHFARAFRITTGMAPHQFLLAQRADKAADMIIGTSRPLSEIAAECGFSDQSHMGRVFLRRFGDTPGERRRLCELKGQ